jgi:L-lactate dehydrogenase complex protein LldG
MMAIDTSEARKKILSAVRNARVEPGLSIEESAVPDIDVNDELVERFRLLAQAEAATTERIANLADVPAAVATYLRGQQLPMRINVAAAGELRNLEWSSVESIECDDGPLAADGDTVLTGCYAGIAEAGVLVMLSSAGHPSEFNFLGATHIAVVRSESIVPKFEHLWSGLRRDFPAELPRMMNWIVGPSRTADLGVPSKLGAHGPARVHIILAD